jgi:hypothetical protein
MISLVDIIIQVSLTHSACFCHLNAVSAAVHTWNHKKRLPRFMQVQYFWPWLPAIPPHQAELVLSAHGTSEFILDQ